MFDLPEPIQGDPVWTEIGEAISLWIDQGAAPQSLYLDTEGVARGMLATAWALVTAGSLPGGVLWLCGRLPPEVALGRAWFRVRGQQSVIPRGLRGLADDCLAALDQRPGPALVVIDGDPDPLAWAGWMSRGPVCTVWVGEEDASFHPPPAGPALHERLAGLGHLALSAEVGDEPADLLALAQLYREFGAPEAAMALLDRVELDGAETWRGRLGYERGRCLMEQGRHADAVAALRACRNELREQGEERLVTAEVDLLLSDAHALQGEWRQAGAMARQALGERVALAGADSVWVAAALDRLGRISTTIDDARGAERAYRAAVTLLDAVAPTDPMAGLVRARWYEALEATLRRGEIE